MATTTNYNWTTPDDTSLVKDGASAIRTLGSSIDTTTKALNPSTTLGDVEYRSSTANTNTRLPIGSTGQVLTVAGGVPTWATPSAGASGLTLIARTSFSGVATQNFDSVFSSTYKAYLVVIEQIYAATGGDELSMRWRYGSTTQTASYYGNNVRTKANSTTVSNYNTSNGSSAYFIEDIGSSVYPSAGYFYAYKVGNTSEDPIAIGSLYTQWAQVSAEFSNQVSDAKQTYTGFQLFTSTGGSNMTGTVAIYGLGV